MQAYLDFLQYILDEGVDRPDRTGVGVRSVFSYEMRFHLARFPLLTTKKIHWRSVAYELLWFLRGDTNIDYLKQNGVRIWNEWADEKGDLGPTYGKQWRAWQASDGRVIDQMQALVDGIKHNPSSRRLLVNAWNVGELEAMHLPPCHLMFQCYVAGGRLSCKLTQRSADAFLGVPFNIASYALLTCMLAHHCELVPGEFIWSGGDCHLYRNHFDQAREQLTRAPYPRPYLQFKRKPETLFDYCFEDIEIVDYRHYPTISAPVAV